MDSEDRTTVDGMDQRFCGQYFRVDFRTLLHAGRGRKMEVYLDDILPFNKAHTQEVLHEIKMIVQSNAIGIPLLALIQGFVALVGYWIFGVPSAVLFGLLTCFATIIPIVGTMLIWVPIVIYLALSGSWGNAIGLAIYASICRFTVRQPDPLRPAKEDGRHSSR